MTDYPLFDHPEHIALNGLRHYGELSGCTICRIARAMRCPRCARPRTKEEVEAKRTCRACELGVSA